MKGSNLVPGGSRTPGRPGSPGHSGNIDGSPAPTGISEDRILAEELDKRWQEIHRRRFLLSLMLLPPLLFFIFLVVWFHEGVILVPIGLALYGYMLAEFFIFRNPARLARRRRPS